MKLKKLGVALVVVTALGAVFASSALAAATTEMREWLVAGRTLTSSETISFSAVGTATFATEVAGTKYVLEATGIKCEGCKIENVAGAAFGSGHLRFKGVTVKEPAGCTVASEIETTALTLEADYMEGEKVYVWLVPTAGDATEFAKFSIVGCALATTLLARGNVFVEAANKTGVEAVEQEVHSSEAINNAAGGSLKVGTKNAVLTGSAKLKLNSGADFGVL